MDQDVPDGSAAHRVRKMIWRATAFVLLCLVALAAYIAFIRMNWRSQR